MLSFPGSNSVAYRGRPGGQRGGGGSAAQPAEKDVAASAWGVRGAQSIDLDGASGSILGIRAAIGGHESYGVLACGSAP